jgi:hypothetical protein
MNASCGDCIACLPSVIAAAVIILDWSDNRNDIVCFWIGAAAGCVAVPAHYIAYGFLEVG